MVLTKTSYFNDYDENVKKKKSDKEGKRKLVNPYVKRVVLDMSQKERKEFFHEQLEEEYEYDGHDDQCTFNRSLVRVQVNKFVNAFLKL